MSSAQKISAIAGVAFGSRNKITNGCMDISQRGTSFVSPAANSYTLDRFLWGNSSAAAVTITQNADVPADNEFQNSLRIAVTTADTSIAAGDYAVIGQVIEGYNVRDLIGVPVSLSFRVRSSKTGVHCVSLRNSGLDRAYVAEYTVSAANTWETKRFTIPAGLITAGTWDWTTGKGLTVSWALAGGATFQTTKDAWQTGNFLCTSSQVNCLDTIGNIFAVTGLQLESSPFATPFEHRPYGAELALCQRYYQRMYDTVDSCFNVSGYNSAGSAFTANCVFPVQMRSTPLVTRVGTWATTNASTQPTVATPSKFGFVFYVLATASGYVNWNNSTAASMYITADAEL